MDFCPLDPGLGLPTVSVLASRAVESFLHVNPSVHMQFHMLSASVHSFFPDDPGALLLCKQWRARFVEAYLSRA